MSAQRSQTATAVQERPAPEGHTSWPDYWKAQGMPWRTEPEIDAERQNYLDKHRSIRPDIEKGIYPFNHLRPKLTRADIEWLLDTHESGGLRGPVHWADGRHRGRAGLDLRGANLRQADLRDLPLARLNAGLTGWNERAHATKEQRDMAAIHLEGANLNGAHLQDADLFMAHLEYGDLIGSKMESTYLEDAHLEGADLRSAQLQHARLMGAHMEGAWFDDANLERASLRGAHLAGARLIDAHLEGAALHDARLGPAKLDSADVERVAKWKKWSWSTDFTHELPAVNLRSAFFDAATTFKDVVLGDRQSGFVSVADTRWGGVNLSLLDWSVVDQLGDERTAHEQYRSPKQRKAGWERLAEYSTAVRANRQLATALRLQGLNEIADRFSYRSQVLQRQVMLRQGRYLSVLGSWLLDRIAGYGYKPMRSFITYLLVVGVFALTYYLLGNNVNPPLDPLSATVFSITSFHGRGFVPGENVLLNNPLTVIAAGEAIIGLLIEITFIATFTQRFFAR